MAIRIKLATLFSFITTLILIGEHLIIKGSFQLTIDDFLKELLIDLAFFIFLAILNYIIAGPVVKPLLNLINRVDTATKGRNALKGSNDVDEILMLERGINSFTDTIIRQDKHIDHINTELHQKSEDMSTLFKNTIEALSKAVYARDPYTASHSRNVMKYSRALSEKLELPAQDIYYLEIGALLHDIGKIGVPEHVLVKAGKLTDSEFDAIRMHPEYGFQIINEIEEFKGKGVRDIVLYHHERIDGRGYPRGLKGEDIPLFARIVSVCDAFDAMTTSRSYRPARDIDTAIEQLRIHSGTQFDAQIVEAFIQCLEENPTLYEFPEVLQKEMLASS